MVNFPNHYKERRGRQSSFTVITHNRLLGIPLLTTEKRKHSNSTQHNHYDVTESCHKMILSAYNDHMRFMVDQQMEQ